MGWERAAGGFALILGLALVAGFITQFRERGYVGWLGVSFLFLAAAGFIWESSPHLRGYLLSPAGVTFLCSLVSAVLHTRERLREIGDRQQAFEAQMLAILEVEKAKLEKAKSSSEENISN
jgi:uncharacterized membrane protein (DUF106 family)